MEEMDYINLLENLRSRLNVLNTSMFLLESKIQKADDKTVRYINQINKELKRIRQLLNSLPEDFWKSTP